jgi:hypothetical protein
MSHTNFHIGDSIALGEDTIGNYFERNCYYVDKSLIVKEFVEAPWSCLLITRPRRFGKSLAMSLMTSFFDITSVNHESFTRLKIFEHEEIVSNYYQKIPVISLTLKNVPADTWEKALSNLKTTISLLARKARDSIVNRWDKNNPYYDEIVDQLIQECSSIGVLENSLLIISSFLCRSYAIKSKELFAKVCMSEYLSAFEENCPIVWMGKEIDDFFLEFKVCCKRKYRESSVQHLCEDLDAFLMRTEALAREKSKSINQRKGCYLFIDEYDSVYHSSISHGYENQAFPFFGTFFTSALKSNPYILRACMFGITRVSKDCILSGLNNLGVSTIMDDNFADKFGFSEDEVREIINVSGTSMTLTELRGSYNGYCFGKKTRVYNPLSVMSAISNEMIRNYWINTASMDFVISLIRANDAQEEVIEAFKKIATSHTFEIPFRQDVRVSFKDPLSSIDILYLLYLCGYFTKYETEDPPQRLSLEENMAMETEVSSSPSTIASIPWMSSTANVPYSVVCLKVPNKEVFLGFRLFFQQLLDMDAVKENVSLIGLLKSASFGDWKNQFIYKFTEGLSYFDVNENTKEAEFHRNMYFFLMSGSGPTDELVSNREHGKGRSDIILSNGEKGQAFIFELKATKDIQDMHLYAKQGLRQIHDRAYFQGFRRLSSSIGIISICFCGKNQPVIMFEHYTKSGHDWNLSSASHDEDGLELIKSPAPSLHEPIASEDTNRLGKDKAPPTKKMRLPQ